jgi:hypothetical protein
MPSLPTGFPSVMPSVITLDITDGYSPSVMFPRETFFWRARIRRWFRRCFRRWVFFLFATELATEMGFTDDCYTDGRDPSVTPSVLLLPTECIDVTDEISPSAKLYNVVVTAITQSSTISPSLLIAIFSCYTYKSKNNRQLKR